MADDDALNAWFCREILPLERGLTAFIRRNWRDQEEVGDLRQEIYARIVGGAQAARPLNPSGYAYTVARNHLINCARRAKIVSFEQMEDLEKLPIEPDMLTPHRHASGRDELRRVNEALAQLPPRCREIVALRKFQGLSSKDVAAELGVGIDHVDHQTRKGLRQLADILLASEGGDDARPIARLKDRDERL